MQKPSLYLFYRTPYVGLLSRRLTKLHASSILEWFQLGWDTATESDIDLDDWVSDECGDRVYGLCSIFEKAREKRLDRPQTWQQLYDLLLKYLYVEGRASDCIQMDAQSLRVRTDDDENDLAYYFIESTCLESTPEAVEYLFTDFEALKEVASDSRVGAFEPAVKLKSVMPNGDKPGVLYGCFLTGTLKLESTFSIHGLRLEDTLDYLRTANPCTGPEKPRDEELLADWPRELRLLRGMVEDADRDLVELFYRAAPLVPDYGTPDLNGPRASVRVPLLQHLKAHAADQKKKWRRAGAEKCRYIQAGHFLLFCGPSGDGWCGLNGPTYFQLFLFDDLWASANSSLANSILRYAKHWDPFQS